MQVGEREQPGRGPWPEWGRGGGSLYPAVFSSWLVVRGWTGTLPCEGPSEPVERTRGAAPPYLSFPFGEMGINAPILLWGGNHSPGCAWFTAAGCHTFSSLPSCPLEPPVSCWKGWAPGPDRFRRRSPRPSGVKFSSAWLSCPQLSPWPLRAL